MSDNKYILNVSDRAARPRSKRLQRLGVVQSSGGGSTVIVNSPSSSATTAPEGHTHTNKAVLDRIAENSDGYTWITRYVETLNEEGLVELRQATEKVKAGFADVAADLTEDSPVFSKFLSRLNDDVAEGNITFEQGIEVLKAAVFRSSLTVGDYIPGADGAAVAPNGNAEVEDITVRGKVDIATSLTLGRNGFRGGAYGGRIWEDPDTGDIRIETDFLSVRKKFEAREIEIQKETHVGGCQIISPAGMKCTRVEPVTQNGKVTAWVCFFDTEDSDGNAVYNEFAPGDLARCQTFNLREQANGMVGNRYWWREVTETGYTSDEKGGNRIYYNEQKGREGYIVVSNAEGRYDNGSGAPEAGDSIVTMGSRKDPSRSNLIILASYGSGSPYIYQFKGIDTFSLNRDNLKTAISPEGNLFTGQFIIENRTGGEEDVMDYIDRGDTLYTLEPTAPVVRTQGEQCDPSELGCAVYMRLGDNARVEIPTAGNVRQAPYAAGDRLLILNKRLVTGTPSRIPVRDYDNATVYAAGSNPVMLNGRLLMDAPTVATVPSTLILRYTVTRTEFIRDTKGNLVDADGNPIKGDEGEDRVATATETVDTEATYGAPIRITADMKQIRFCLYDGATLLAERTVAVQEDAKGMRQVFNTRFEVGERKITALTQRVTETEDAVQDAYARIEQTADSISAEVNRTDTLLLGEGGNLLIGTNRGAAGWGYVTDSAVSWFGDSAPVVSGGDDIALELTTSERNDSSHELLTFPIRAELIRKGDKYTVSLDVDIPLRQGAVDFFAIVCDKEGKAALTDRVAIGSVDASDRAHLCGTLTAIADGALNGSQVLCIGVEQDTTGIFLDLLAWNLKMERGETETPWCPAIEDYGGSLYTRLNTLIELTAEGLRSHVTKEIGNAEDDLRQDYSSTIEQTAEQIRTEVSAADTALGIQLRSEIRQTASEISLKVDAVKGYENLVKSKGWTNTANGKTTSAVVSLVHPGLYAIANTSASSSAVLRSPSFTLEASKLYCFHFNQKPSSLNMKSATMRIVTADGVTLASVAPPLRLDGIDAFGTFTTPSGNPLAAYIEFTHRGSTTEGESTTLAISQVMVEEGDTAHPWIEDAVGLEATGIDIENRKVTLTADTFLFRDNRGRVQAVIEGNKIRADLIDANSLTARNVLVGDKNGQRVEIEPQTKSITVYDADKTLCTELNGNSHKGGVAEIYGMSAQSEVQMYENSATETPRIGEGNVTKTAGGTTTLVSGKWQTASAARVTLGGGNVSLTATAGAPSASAGGLQTGISPYCDIALEIWLDTADDSAFTQNLQSRLMHSTSASSVAVDAEATGRNADRNTPLTGISATAAKKGWNRLRMVITATMHGSGSQANATWNGITAASATEFYKSELFANGMVLGKSTDSYFLVYADEGNEMNMEMRRGDSGIRVTEEGAQVMHSGGWVGLPKPIWHGRVALTSTSCTASEAMKWGVESPTFHRSDTGKVRITFPQSWAKLGLTQDNILVTATSIGAAPLTVGILSVSATDMVLGLSGGGADANGTVSLNISKV